MKNSAHSPAWQGKAFVAIKVARVSTHAMMLSAYIGSLSNIQPGGTQPLGMWKRTAVTVRWVCAAEYHAKCLLSMSKFELDHNQIDILTSWLVKTARFIPGRKRLAVAYAKRGLRLAHTTAGVLPHQKALAFITFARAASLPRMSLVEDIDVRESILSALVLEAAVRQEEDVLQALRQWVRVLKGVGELLCKLGEFDEAFPYLAQALRLAEGEADVPSQVAQITVLIERMPDD